MSRRPSCEAEQNKQSRRVICIPIIHTQADLGQLGRSVKDAHVRRVGRAGWEAQQRSVAELWERIRRRIEHMDLDFHCVQVYQDGLPLCGQEERIVRELASQGSANHRLLVDLIERGARLMGTESPQLLLQEYELNRRILGVDGGRAAASPAAVEIRQEAMRLLEQRDQFIADRIAATLEPGECGLIFLGMLHSLEGRLPPDIRLEILPTGDRKKPPPRGPHAGSTTR